jgi:predicted ArsR family transcriptional regulator
MNWRTEQMLRHVDGMGDSTTRVLLEVIKQPRPTVDSVAAALGVAKSTAHRHLSILRDRELVAYGDGQQGALRPLVRPVVPRVM